MSIYHVAEGETFLITGPAKVDLVSDIAPVIGSAETPTVSSLEPDTAVAGDAEDIEMIVNGTGFNELSKIVFGGHDEPTTKLSDTQVRTIVKPSMFAVPDDVAVAVRNGELLSNEMDFSFTAAARSAQTDEKHATKKKSSR